MSFEGLQNEELEIQVPQENLRIMNSLMQDTLYRESVGGNAGSVQIEGVAYSCAAANFYINKETGKIVIFGNFQSIPERIRDDEQYLPMVFKIAVDPKTLGFFKIVATSGYKDLSTEATENLRESIRLYNQQFTN